MKINKITKITKTTKTKTKTSKRQGIETNSFRALQVCLGDTRCEVIVVSEDDLTWVCTGFLVAPNGIV